MVALPMIPVDSIPKALVFTLEVETIEVRVMAGAVPPGSLEPPGTVLTPGVVVPVHRAELGSFLRQTLPKLPINTSINDPELEELGAYDEVVDGHTGGVALPVLQFY